MTRHMPNQLSYPNESSLETYRHPSRVPPAPPAHERAFVISRSNPRTDPLRQPSRPNPAPHVTSSAASSPRRRIPVACGRCRKRKIRCSGDPGDTTGCQNCRAAQVQGQCVFLRVQCEMRELVPDHVLMMGYEQVSSAQVDLHHHPYSSSSSASSSASSLAMAGVSHHNTAPPNQNYNLNSHALRIGHSGQNHHIHNNAMPLRSLCHQDPLGGHGSGGDSTAGLLLSGRYDGLGGDMTGSAIHGSNGNVMSVSSGDMYNGSYAPQYLHPDIGQGISNSLHSQQWASMAGGRNSSLYLDQDNYITPNQSIGTFNVVFPALSSLSSSLPDGVSLRAPGSEKVQLPPPIRTQASEAIANNARPPPTGNSLVNDSVSSNYERQSLQAPYRVFPSNSWTGDASFSPAPQSAGMAVHSNASGIPSQTTPALPVPCQISTYSTHNPPTFPLSSSNSSLLPSLSHQNPLLSSSSGDSFPQALTQNQKNCSNSESSNSSKIITPATNIRKNSTPSYTRSSVGGCHQSNDQFGDGYTNLV